LCGTCSSKFNSHNFDEGLANGRITRKEVNEFLKELYKEIGS
jgi:hypothetical protein